MIFNIDKEKYSKYLPSKKLVIISIICLFLFIVIFLIFFSSSEGEMFSKTKKEVGSGLKVENQTITELMQSDKDQDGVADWEEALWGTDQNKKITFDNTPDATYIENKKESFKIQEKDEVEEQKLTETEKFAREFFTSYSAMKSSGQIDNETINNFSSALGQKIVNPELIDRYKAEDIHTIKDEEISTKKAYYQNMKSLFETYKSSGLGEELSIVSGGLATGSVVNEEQTRKLNAIASAYQNFAKKSMELSVPESLAGYHLRISNSANNTGISVASMGKIVSDPIIGLSGLSQYQKYSEDLVTAVNELEGVLE